MSKSKRTQQRYQKSWKSQQSLSSFGFTKVPHPRMEHNPLAGKLAPTLGTDATGTIIPRARSASMMSESDSSATSSNDNEATHYRAMDRKGSRMGCPQAETTSSGFTEGDDGN